MKTSYLSAAITLALMSFGATLVVRADPFSPPIFLNTVGTLSGGSSVTLTGTLPNQGTPLEIPFTLATASSFTAYTTSYASGGFQPNLTLYTGAGQYLDTQLISGTSPIAGVNATTGQNLDGYLHEDSLAAGSYILTVSDFLLQQSVTATSLADGFTFNIGSGDQSYIDEQGNSLNGNYSITLAASPVPEPATIGVLGFAGALLLVRRRRVH